MSTAPIKIHQIFYKKEQVPKLDESFIPFDNIINPNPEWHEYWIFLSNYENGNVKENELTGFVSWKFGMKTGLAGKKFIDFIQNNPGHDVYFVCPLPEQSYVFSNIWQQAEHYHPGIIDFTQNLMNKLGIKIDLATAEIPVEKTLFCNYWVGNKKFWDDYISFTKPLYNYINNSLSIEEKKFIHARADKTIRASYIAFIQERLFSTLLYLRGDKIKSIVYRYDDEDIVSLYNKDEELVRYFKILRYMSESKLKDKDFIELKKAFSKIYLEWLLNRVELHDLKKRPSVSIQNKIKSFIRARFPGIHRFLSQIFK